MGDSYSESSNVARDLIRLVFAFLDRPAYWLLGVMYQLFFNVASADLFSNATIMKFYGRVQVILGVFMMFQLAMTILRGIIEPDSFSKEKGAGTLIRRVIVSLILITILMPINIPNPRNEYENQLNNNGLMFGTLYSLQHRILANNTLGRLVLGTNDTNATYISDPNDTELERSARIFTSTILKGFYRINLVPEDERVDTGTKDPATAKENRMCKDMPDDILDAYTRIDAEPGDIISMVNETCSLDESLSASIINRIPGLNSIAGSKKYMFTYMPFISMVVAIVFVFILLSFTMDIAVRAVKLAVLRLLAPIPIIAYMDPKGSGDESFKSWTKTLTSTYLDLFIRLAVVYFIIFLIQDMIVNGFVINHVTGVIGVLSLIIIWIGLFVFAKQAPKFIKQVLGLKNDPGKLFGGLSDIINTVGAAGATAAGAIGSARASSHASYLADKEKYLAEGQKKGLTGDALKNYAEQHARSSGNRAKHVVAGIAGGATGVATGASAAWNAKDHQARAASDAINQRNARVLESGRDGGTLFGALGSEALRMVRGESPYDEMEAQWKADEEAIKADELALKQDQDDLRKKQESLKSQQAVNGRRKALMDRAKSEAATSTKTTGTVDMHDIDSTIPAGTATITGNYASFASALSAAKASGSTSFLFNGHTIQLDQAELIGNELLKKNQANYYNQAISGTISDGTFDAERAAFKRENGDVDVEATWDDVKSGYATKKEEHDKEAFKQTQRSQELSEKSEKLSRRRNELNTKKQSHESRRTRAESKRFKRGK